MTGLTAKQMVIQFHLAIRADRPRALKTLSSGYMSRMTVTEFWFGHEFDAIAPGSPIHQGSNTTLNFSLLTGSAQSLRSLDSGSKCVRFGYYISRQVGTPASGAPELGLSRRSRQTANDKLFVGTRHWRMNLDAEHG